MKCKITNKKINFQNGGCGNRNDCKYVNKKGCIEAKGLNRKWIKAIKN